VLHNVGITERFIENR